MLAYSVKRPEADGTRSPPVQTVNAKPSSGPEKILLMKPKETSYYTEAKNGERNQVRKEERGLRMLAGGGARVLLLLGAEDVVVSVSFNGPG